MANQVFPLAREGFANAEIAWGTAVIKSALVRNYTYNASHKFVSDITASGATLHATSTALTSKTYALGVLDAADLTFSSVTANATNHYILIFQSSAVTGGADVAASAQRVIALLDTVTNIPVQPNGGNVVITWDNGANKILVI